MPYPTSKVAKPRVPHASADEVYDVICFVTPFMVTLIGPQPKSALSQKITLGRVLDETNCFFIHLPAITVTEPFFTGHCYRSATKI